MKKKITTIVSIFVLACIIIAPKAYAASVDLDFSGDWSKKEMTDIAINNGNKLDTSVHSSDFASRKDYEDYMWKKYGKKERKKLNPKNYSRLLLDENGEVVDFRPSEKHKRDVFITYQLPILEALTDVQDKANNLEKAVESSF